MSEPTIGQKAPDFSALTDQNQTLSLQDFAGKYLVIFFYPMDDTPGCTKESCEFRDLKADFGALNAEIIGISPDDVASHQKFVSKFSLNFPLLADTDEKIRNDYQLGKNDIYIERATFVVAPDSTLIAQWRKIKDVAGHVDEVLASIKEHQA